MDQKERFEVEMKIIEAVKNQEPFQEVPICLEKPADYYMYCSGLNENSGLERNLSDLSVYVNSKTITIAVRSNRLDYDYDYNILTNMNEKDRMKEFRRIGLFPIISTFPKPKYSTGLTCLKECIDDTKGAEAIDEASDYAKFSVIEFEEKTLDPKKLRVIYDTKNGILKITHPIGNKAEA